MSTPKVYSINKPSFSRPSKDFLFDKIPVYFFPQHGSSVMGIDFIFNVNPDVLVSNSNLMISSLNSFLTCGTSNLNEFQINNIIDSLGGYFSKTYNRNHFDCSLHILSDSISEIIPIISDCIFNPVFPENIIKNKLKNQKELFAISSMRVTEKAKVKFREIIYGNDHPFGTRVNLKDFDNIDSKYLKQIHKKICNFQLDQNQKTNNLNIIISGDFPKNIKKLLENNLPNCFHKTNFKKLYPIKDNREASSIYVCKDSALQTAFRIGRILPGHNHEDFFGLKVLITILGGYFGSRLMANIREEKGYTYGIGAFLITQEFYSEMNIVTEAGSKYTKDVYQEIIKEINILRSHEVSLSELNRVKSYLLGAILHNCNGLFPQVSVFKDLQKHNSSFDYFEKFISEINNINPKKIQILAQKYFDIQEISFVACGPLQEKIW